MKTIANYPDFYDPALNSVQEQAKPLFLESYFFKNRTYSIRVAQIAQRSLFGAVIGSFCTGAVILPWASPTARTSIGALMLTGMALSLTGCVGNYLFYRQVCKPHNPDFSFHPVNGPIPIDKL